MVPPALKLEQGIVRGTTGTDLNGGTIFKFKGIPYAKPPLGDLRFKAPQPPENWTGILDATKERDICYSRDFQNPTLIKGSEDCLYLNVYTKNLTKTSLRPVMFWIHGGGFISGSGNEELYGPDFLLTEDVVLVTINYRLGLLGFISFEDPSLEVPGNAGFKDQVMALKWVQKNIINFGGDPNNVTIFGESAGSGSVHLLTLSPMSKNLFHKAIAQSGCVFNPAGQATPGVAKLAKIMNMEGVEDAQIFQKLMEKPVGEIFELQEKLVGEFDASEKASLGFVVEKNSMVPFLDQEPLEIVLQGKYHQVPFIIGYNSCEAMVLDSGQKPEEFSFESTVPWYFGYQNGSPEAKLVAEKIKRFYFGDELSEKNMLKKYDLLTDCHFVHGIHLAITHQLCKSKSPSYFYKMTLESDLNFLKKLLKLETPGVCHCDDLGYLFKHFATPEIKPGSLEKMSLKKIVKLWTNFAKFGNPTPDQNLIWKPISGPNLDYLEIGEELVPGINPDLERVKFWNQLYSESPNGSKVETCNN